MLVFVWAKKKLAVARDAESGLYIYKMIADIVNEVWFYHGIKIETLPILWWKGQGEEAQKRI